MFLLAQAGYVNAAPAALTFTVNQTADLVDADGSDNRCDTNLALAGDQCSLRAAIQQANHTRDTDTIDFVSSAVHKLTRSGQDDNAHNDNAAVTNSTMDDLSMPGVVALRDVTVGSLKLCDSTGVCGNAGTTGLFNSLIGTCIGSYSSLGYNLLQTQDNCILTGNQAGNLFNVDAKLGRLANNGGLTLTRKLLAGSPAIDGGNPSGCVFGNNLPLTTDQRGFPRPTDGDGANGARCDIGAFEVGAVGIGSLSPHKGSSNIGEQTVFDLAWDSPTRWRDLNTVDLRFKRGHEIVLWLRFTEGLPTSTFSLLDKDGNVVDSGNAGQVKLLQNKFGMLHVASSGFTASGPNDPHVMLHFAVTFKKQAEGKLKTQLLATDDFVNAQGPEPGGTWRVK